MEPPIHRPRYLPKSVLWDYEDSNDAAEGVIVTEANKRRPKMNLAICRGDGTNISNQEYVNIRRAADIICTGLLNRIDAIPGSAVLLANKAWTKSTLRKTFGVEYRQAVLNLEAEQKILRLCSAHWKADAVIGQALLRRSEMEAKAGSNRTTSKSSSRAKNSQPLEQFASFVPQDSAANTAKRGFEMSPGPKSPSALHTQKRGKKTAGLPKRSDRKHCSCCEVELLTSRISTGEATPCRTDDNSFVP